jgi:hypothetical protein
MSYAWQQRLRLGLVVISPILFTLQVLAALLNPQGFGWLVASAWAALGIYFAWTYRKAKQAHDAVPTKIKPGPTKIKPGPTKVKPGPGPGGRRRG